MKKFFSFLRKPKAKPNSGPRNRVLTAAEIAAQEEQKRKLEEQQAKAASRKKAQRTAKAAKPRNRILKEGESATTGARPTRTRWFKRRKQRSPQERAARRTQNSIGPIVRDILSGEFLTREGVTRHIPYLIIVRVMFIAYIVKNALHIFYGFISINHDAVTCVQVVNTNFIVTHQFVVNLNQKCKWGG